MQPTTKIQPDSHDKRGDSTRFALIEAGLDLFGEFGFKGTTTRMLSDSASANISAIPYYFGSKKGLYLAVMEYIVERMQEHFVEVRVVMEKNAALWSNITRSGIGCNENDDPIHRPVIC